MHKTEGARDALTEAPTPPHHRTHTKNPLHVSEKRAAVRDGHRRLRGMVLRDVPHDAAGVRHPTYAIRTFGTVIHEFDPWFNYRATEYLDEHGWHAFFHWFDYESWYPLGRPVGTTIYPGMQITSVCIKRLLALIGRPMTLNDVCCYVPAWFGVLASWCLGSLTRECSNSMSCGAFAALIMALVPAHIMRSVGGGYDNESIAMTAMCLTFWMWARALRPDAAASDDKAGADGKDAGAPTRSSYVFGVLTGVAYIYMVMAWGGFVFVLNMIGVHAAALVLFGRYSTSVTARTRSSTSSARSARRACRR